MTGFKRTKDKWQRHWFAARPLLDDTCLNRKNLYIFINRSGGLLLLVMLVILLVGVNYNNSMAYLLSFLLFSVLMVSMLVTHNNLSGIAIRALTVDPVFAGQAALFRFTLHPPEMSANQAAINETVVNETAQRYGIVLTLRNGMTQIQRQLSGKTSSVMLPIPTQRRGLLPCPDLKISSTFPLGVLYAWSRWFAPRVTCLVYPQPSAIALPMPCGNDSASGDRAGESAEGDDFIGLREFNPHDSPRHVSWKTVAAGRGMYVKQYGGASECWFDWAYLPKADTEQRLSWLCRWIVDAHAAGTVYGLRLPNVSIAPSSGQTHYRACLEQLARH